MNSMWFRYAQPVGRVLLRASLPVNTLPMSDGKYESGLGDFNMLAAYLFTKPTSANQMGIGPIITAPTATSRALGSGKWQAGVVLAGYFAGSNTLQLGFLGTWQHSFAGDDDRADAQMMTLQSFLMWQLGKGLYMRSSGIATLDLVNDNYTVPVGLGIGKILKMNKTVFNLHSDQGVQYACQEFRRALDRNIVQSMSRRGNCWDNALVDSFFEVAQIRTHLRK